MVSERPKSARPSTDDVYPDFGDSNVQSGWIWLSHSSYNSTGCFPIEIHYIVMSHNRQRGVSSPILPYHFMERFTGAGQLQQRYRLSSGKKNP